MTPCLFGGVHRLCLQNLLGSEAVEGKVVAVQVTTADEAAVNLSLARDTGERSASRRDGVPRRETPPLALRKLDGPHRPSAREEGHPSTLP